MAANWGSPIAQGRVTRYDWSRPGAIDGLDPYLAWLDESGPTRHVPLARYGGWLPVAAEAVGASKILALRDLGFASLPPLHERAAAEADPSKPFQCTLRLVPSAQALAALRERGVRIDLGLPQCIAARDDDAPVQPCPAVPARPMPVGGMGEVVIGIIDDGCAFAHPAFCQVGAGGARRTRVEWLWDQGGEIAGPTEVWRKPPAFGYGREAAAAQLDRAIADSAVGPGGAFVEDLAYASAEVALPARRASHGAAVMGLAAGASEADDPASRSPIVFVQLPRQAVDDTSAGWLSVHALDALAYIFAKAGSRPVVVNMSFGGQAGPHDGSSILERAMDRMLEQPGRAIVLAAGNGCDADGHANVRLAAGESVELAWWLEPDDPSDSFAEVRAMDPATGESMPIEIRVTPFAGEASGWVAPGTARIWRDGDEPMAALYNLTGPEQGEDRCALLCVGPTAASAAPAPAPFSRWSIGIRNRGDTDVAVDAYVERDDSPFGRVRLRQSRLRGEHVTPLGTLSSVATGRHTIVVAGYRISDNSIAAYSASGPTRAGVLPEGAPRAGITLAAPCERSPQQATLDVIGPRGSSAAELAGTSVAAPQVTRAVACLLARNEGAPMGVDRIRALLRPREGHNLRPPTAERGGMGALEP